MLRNLTALAAAIVLSTATARADDPPGFTGTVLQAADAGTLLIRPAGEKKPVTVRLIGLTPPVKATRDKDGQEPWATRGQQALAVLAVRKDVRVEFDAKRNEPGEAAVWGYVWVPADGGPVLANEAVLVGGHAVLDTRPPNVQYSDRLRDAQRAAREAGRNIWDVKEPLPEAPAEYAGKAKEAKAEVATLAAWREGCVVGNRKSKKYHPPGGKGYADAKGSKNAVFFADEDDKKAGYEKAAR